MGAPPDGAPADGSDPGASEPTDAFGTPDDGAPADGAPPNGAPADDGGSPGSPGAASPPAPSAGGSHRTGSGAAEQSDTDGGSSAAEVARQLQAEAGQADAASDSNRTRHSDSAADPAGAAAPEGDTTTTLSPEDVASDLLPGSDEPADATAPPPAEETPLDAAPPLNQAGHTTHPKAKAALWATALAFGALLLISSAWIWVRRRRYDPA